MSWINRQLYMELSGVEMFITAQLVYIDFNTRKVRIASAGHCPLLFVSDENQDLREIAPEGMPLGVMPATAYEESEVELEKGMRLLLFTDGLPEAKNSAGDFWGVDTLRELFSRKPDASGVASDLKTCLTSELNKFQAGAEQSDDQTFIAFSEKTQNNSKL